MKQLTTILLLFCAISSFSQTNNIWSGGAGGWQNASKWSLGVVPNAGHRVVVNVAGSNITLGSGVNTTVNSMILGSGTEITINGTLKFNTSEWTALENEGTVTNNGTIEVIQTGGNNNNGQGILNEGEFVNDGTIILGSTSISKNGIVSNNANAEFTNNGAIEAMNVGEHAVRINSGTIYNHGTISCPGNVTQKAIKTNAGLFVNIECAVFDSGNRQVDAPHMNNLGTIFEFSTSNSNVKNNSGVIFNGNGGVFTVNETDNGLVTSETDLIYWTGCVSNDWKNLDNWISPLPSFALSSSHQYIPANPFGGNGFPIATTKVNINNALDIEEGAEATIDGPPNDGLGNNGTLENAGVLNISNTIDMGLINDGILNNSGTINISEVVNAAFQNNGDHNAFGSINFTSGIQKNAIVNTGTWEGSTTEEIHISEAGISGILNTGTFSIAGECLIENATNYGVSNASNFTIASDGIVECSNSGIADLFISPTGTTTVNGLSLCYTTIKFMDNQGEFEIGDCGVINASGELETSGTLTNNGHLSLQSSNDHTIAGSFTNNGFISDQGNHLEIAAVTNNGAYFTDLIIDAGGTYSPLGEGSFAGMTLLPNSLSDANTGALLGTINVSQNSFTSLSSLAEGTYPGLGSIQLSGCEINGFLINVTIDNSIGDSDGDGIDDPDDNCPDIPNPNQENNDGDSEGDVCDEDDDNDGTNDVDDCAPFDEDIYEGAPCNDNDACTINDMITSDCECEGTFQDSDNDGTCDADDECPGGPEPGTSCNDNDACTINDVITSDCECEGTFQDSDNDGTCDADDVCPGGPEPGTSCTYQYIKLIEIYTLLQLSMNMNIIIIKQYLKKFDPLVLLIEP